MVRGYFFSLYKLQEYLYNDFHKQEVGNEHDIPSQVYLLYTFTQNMIDDKIQAER